MHAAASLFRGLGEPTRLLILRHLLDGEHRVVDLVAHLGLAQSTVSGHLACLRDCGLVTSQARGRASVFTIARPEIVALLQAAEAFLEETGQRAALCPTYGVPAPGGSTPGPSTSGPSTSGPSASEPAVAAS